MTLNVKKYPILGEEKNNNPSDTYVEILIHMDEDISEFRKDEEKRKKEFFEALSLVTGTKDIQEPNFWEGCVQFRALFPLIPAMRLLQKYQILSQANYEPQSLPMKLMANFVKYFKIKSILSTHLKTGELSDVLEIY